MENKLRINISYSHIFTLGCYTECAISPKPEEKSDILSKKKKEKEKYKERKVVANHEFPTSGTFCA
jgi:hypothetical protein